MKRALLFPLVAIVLVGAAFPQADSVVLVRVHGALTATETSSESGATE